MNNKISCVINTYRRFTCVNRSIRFFLNQKTNIDRELIIYNTDVDNPLILSSELPDNITIINNNTDYITDKPYNNLGSIRRDSLNHASGDYYICWDDDDIFLPWHIQQCVDGITRHPDAWAWKPFMSMFWKTACPPELADNNMEASILINLEKLRAIGFNPHQGGGEHLNWLETFKKLNKLAIDKESIPSYCFNWADQGIMRGHKQSGTINREDNFTYHKENTNDFAARPLDGNYPVEEIYEAHINTIKQNLDMPLNNEYIIKSNLVEKYIYER